MKISWKQAEASSLEAKRHTKQAKSAEMLAGGKRKQARKKRKGIRNKQNQPKC